MDFKLLFSHNPNPVLIYDSDTLNILEVNDSAIKKYGYSRPEFLSLTIRDLRPEEYIPELERIISRAKDEDIYHRGAHVHRSKNGDTFYMQVSGQSFSFKEHKARLVFLHDVTQSIKAEERARLAFSELDHHLKNTPLAMVRLDHNFAITDWSKRAEEISGYSKEEVMGISVLETPLIEEPTARKLARKLYALRRGENERNQTEITIRHKYGNNLYLRLYSSALSGKDGRLESIVALIENLTEHRKIEERYQKLFESANDGIFIMKENIFVDCNSRVLDLFGVSKKEVIGRTPTDFSPELQPGGEVSAELAAQKIELVLNGKPQVFEWRHKKKNGECIDAEVSLNRLELMDGMYVQAVVRDLTEQKEARKKLRENQELFQKLFTKSPEAIIMVDAENRVQRVNESFESLFGYTEAELVNKDIDAFIVRQENEQSQRLISWSSLMKGKFYPHLKRYAKSGEALDIMLGIIPVYLDKEPLAAFGIYVDVTDQKESERKLEKSLKEKQVLLEEVHHRVKNNLAVISGLLQLQIFESTIPEVSRTLNDSQLRIKTIALVHEMLYKTESFSEIALGQYFNELCKAIEQTYSNENKNIAVHLNVQDISLNINQAIPCALLINELLTNAYKHAFTEQQSGEINITLDSYAEHIHLQIADNGKGLPADFQPKEATSLGMSVMQTLTDQLEAEWKWSSKPGKGCCFLFTFVQKDMHGSASHHRLANL